MTTDELTELLYERSDRKLRQWCKIEFENLLKTCQENDYTIPETNRLHDDDLKRVMTNIGLSVTTTNFPNFKQVLDFASEIVFHHLRDIKREQEIKAFLDKVDHINSDELYEI